MKEKKYSIVENNSNIVNHVDASQIVETIRMGTGLGLDFKSKVQRIRGEDENRDKLKRSMPGFTPTGTFKGSRNTDNLENYSGLMQVDLDHLSEEQVEQITAKLPTAKYVYFGFKSVSGKGIKLMIRTNASKEAHIDAFNQVCDLVDREFNVESDRAVKSVAQQCYFSYDPDIYYNPNSEILDILELADDNYLHIFNRAVKIVSKSYQFKEGSRNVFIYNLACICHKYGIPEEKAINFIDANYKFEEQSDNRELLSAIQSAYKNRGFGEWEIEAPDKPTSFPEELYELLSPFLRDLCLLFREGHERDTFLLGALSVISGCFPTVWGEYARYRIHANLYGFIIAPAASGKGVIGFSKMLADALNDKIYNQSRASHKDCLQNDDTLDCPPIRTLIIPGNNSSAGIIDDLNNNNGIGIICESEADTIGNNFSREWGNFSPILRQAYHHETISYSRKGIKENIIIKDPKLSICLTSTPAQIYSIMRSPEDGLFSRFMYYSFKPIVKWISPRPTKQTNALELEANLNQSADIILTLSDKLQKSSIEFRLSDKQWDDLDKFFGQRLKEFAEKEHHGFQSNIKRMGVITFRIAMVLTISRNIHGFKTETITCQDSDFEAALLITSHLLDHAFKIYQGFRKTLPITSNEGNNKVLELHNVLPHKFKANEFIKSAIQNKIPERSAYRLLKEMNNVLWSKVGQSYEKIALLPTGSLAVI